MTPERGREIVHEGKPYKIQLKTRGYRYNLNAPIAVHVLEGRIRGDRKSPVDSYIPKPTQAPAPGDQLTPESSPEATAPDVTPMTPVAPASP